MKRAILFLLFLAPALTLPGYDFLTKNGLRWPDGDIPMNLQLDVTRMLPQFGLLDGKSSWNEAAQEALDIWNRNLSRVQFTTVASFAHGDGNEHNEVFFSAEVYGQPFGADVLAITTTWRRGAARAEGDTIFNSAIDWDSYAGPLDFGYYDLVRVATHEFGHTLGLDHPDQAGQIVVSIMNSLVSDLDSIALDDLHGVRALYPPATNFSLNVSLPDGGGTVLASPPPDLDGRYPAGTVVTLTAKPARRHRFNFWGDEENSAARKLRVLVLDDEFITANFSTNGAPVFRTQPRSVAIRASETVTFTARAAGPAPITYQWRHNDGEIPAATNATLVLNFVGHENSGLYSVRATNARGATTSRPARLVVGGY